jgi:thiosulfate reductase cytochrome b subunit
MARHGLVVRVTHWINAIGTLALIVSGIAILLAHPRLYWGETGAVGTPSLIDLPIPFVFGHSGWGRYLHFLAAWICVGTGVLYLPLQFSKHALVHSYTGAQRLTYVLVFVLGPIVLLSGLAFSPMLASIAPALVGLFGGQQSARTIHFFAAAAVVVFLVVHVAMVATSGFTAHMRSMIVGDQG